MNVFDESDFPSSELEELGIHAILSLKTRQQKPFRFAGIEGLPKLRFDAVQSAAVEHVVAVAYPY